MCSGRSMFKEVLSLNIWPAGLVDIKALKLAHTRVLKRRERASAGAGGPKVSQRVGGAAGGGGEPTGALPA